MRLCYTVSNTLLPEKIRESSDSTVKMHPKNRQDFWKTCGQTAVASRFQGAVARDFIKRCTPYADGRILAAKKMALVFW